MEFRNMFTWEIHLEKFAKEFFNNYINTEIFIAKYTVKAKA